MIATEEQLSRLESLIGAQLPQDYRDFMLTSQASAIEHMDYWLAHPDGRWIETVEELHSGEQLLQMMEMEVDLRGQGLGDHPSGTIPIANNGCGDSVLLSYRGGNLGAVFHEFMEEADMDDRWRGVYPLAPSFKAWTQMLARVPTDEEA